MINHDIGLTFGKTFSNIYPSYKTPIPKTFCPEERNEKGLERTFMAGNYTFVVNRFETDKFRDFKQKLDHYDPTDDEYFKQRYYFYKADDYVKGNPVFLLVGGAGELEFSDLEKGIWNHFAIESSALLLALEHRLYGFSFPNYWNFHVENLEYLNVDQALADLAFFIDEIVLHNPEDITISPDAKWIALGSSYGGTLAALLKFQYPHKITAAVTLNAPLLATTAFEGFFNIVENQCEMAKVDETIREAFTELKKGFDSCVKSETKEGFYSEYNKHLKTFNDCPSLKSHVNDHIALLFWSLTTIIGLALQFGNENGRTVKTDVTNILLDKEEIPDALNRLGAAVKLVLQSHNIKCLNVDFEKLIANYQDKSPYAEKNLNYILYTALGNRLTLYQRCTQWGQFATAYKNDGIFAELIPIDFYVKICIKVFGRMFHAEYLDNAIERTNVFFGGREINVSKVMYIMRDDDLWKQLGFSGGKPKDEITDEDSIAVLLKADDSEQSVSRELIDEWNYILRTLKRWSGVEITEENSGQGSVQNVAVIPTPQD